MEINPFLLVVIALLVFGAGYVFHMLDSRVTSALKDGREPLPKDVVEKAAPKIDEHGVLRVTVDPAVRWHLELDGVHLEPDGVSAEQRARLVNVIVQIRPWIDGKTPAAAPSPAVATGPASLVTTDLSPAVAAALPLSMRPVEPTTPPMATKLDFGRGFRSMLEKDLSPKKAELPPPTSIVSMIDDVLQQKLVGSPLAAKRIRLEEGSLGEVVVFVGAARYSGVDAVPDDDVKALIRSAIADWDKKTT